MNRCHGLVFSVVRWINEQLVLNEMGTSYPLPLRLIPACRLMCGSGSALPTSCFLLTRGSAPRAEPKIQVDTCRRAELPPHIRRQAADKHLWSSVSKLRACKPAIAPSKK